MAHRKHLSQEAHVAPEKNTAKKASKNNKNVSQKHTHKPDLQNTPEKREHAYEYNQDLGKKF